MTHEFKLMVQAQEQAAAKGQKAVMASVVALEGSSYRKPGVRMLVLEDGSMVGAVSGGCVEKEIVLQSQSVFQDSIPKLMVYDGRYRLGCEGILYILIEPFDLSPSLRDQFKKALQARIPFELNSFFVQELGTHKGMGTSLSISGVAHFLSQNNRVDTRLNCFVQEFQAAFRLVILGAEHDAVQLCTMASQMGWEVQIVCSPDEAKDLSDFPGAQELIPLGVDAIKDLALDEQTAVLLMSHNYAKDLSYLMALAHQQTAYVGLLGPVKRREALFGELLERVPDIPLHFLEGVHGPAGLDIGSETPQEIALSILSEILTVTRKRTAVSLRAKTETIHS